MSFWSSTCFVLVVYDTCNSLARIGRTYGRWVINCNIYSTLEKSFILPVVWARKSTADRQTCQIFLKSGTLLWISQCEVSWCQPRDSNKLRGVQQTRGDRCVLLCWTPLTQYRLFFNLRTEWHLLAVAWNCREQPLYCHSISIRVLTQCHFVSTVVIGPFRLISLQSIHTQSILVAYLWIYKSKF